MKLSAEAAARLIDISAVQAPHGEKEIREMAAAARTHHFIAVHVLPCWVPFLKRELAGSPDILIGAPVGFPGGGHRTEIKVEEARMLVQDGVQEMDMMLNVGKMRSGDASYCEREIRAVVQAVAPVPVKVIIEAAYLDQDQIRRACDACIAGGAAFVKTGTGWARSGATLDVVKLITSHVGGRIKVKAAGGIRSLDTVVGMLRLGVARFGINLETAVEIIRAIADRPGGFVEV